MGIGLSQIKHVKLPVSDLRRSASWYRTLLDLDLVTEYFEDGQVRGVTLADRGAGFEIALRQREYCAGQPNLAGFDVLALRAPTRDLVDSIAERCDRLDVKRSEIWDFPGFGRGFDVPDPDGMPVRIVWHDPEGGFASGFIGIATGAAGRPEPYYEPRLSLEATNE
jgi:catechol 2,3-dioxygenase-like lactoylglutathione lyase family enzyme